MAKTAKLTEKQQRFVEEYLIDLNATQSAIRAGYSAKTADQHNATDDDLACIESVKYKQSESETGSSVEMEVKISPKLKALELLGKHLGMWNDKIDVNITQPIVITGEDALED